jgi:hypothetical protein
MDKKLIALIILEEIVYKFLYGLDEILATPSYVAIFGVRDLMLVA